MANRIVKRREIWDSGVQVEHNFDLDCSDQGHLEFI